MADSWFLGTNPLNQLGNTIGRTPTGAALPSVSQAQQQQSNAAQAQALEAYFAEERRRWDADYSQKQKNIDNQYDLARRSAKTAEAAQALDDWYKRESAALARERLTQDKYEFDKTHELDVQKFGLDQAKLGYDLIGTAAQLRGPENYFAAAEYARGVSGNPQTSTFLSALQNNTKMADYGAQGGLPNPETLGTLTAKLNAGGNAVTDNSGNYLAQVGNIAAKGAHQLGPGSLESLTDTERSLFGSGLDELGVDKATFLDQYRRSRVGQGIAGVRAA